MGHRPRHRKVMCAARRIVALATAVALVVAQIIVILTHGPAAHLAAADMAQEIATHGHSHGETGSGPFAGHDATDHEHQLQALIAQTGEAARPAASGAQAGVIRSFRGLSRDGPKRPPRMV